MGKYIIDVPDEGKYRLGQTYIFANNGERVVVSCNLTDLTPYTESDREAIEDEVWAFARTVGLRAFFDDNHNLHPYLDYFDSYQDAKAKHEELKRREDEIYVGDEVEYPPNKAKGIVIKCHVPDVCAEIDKYAIFTGTSVEYFPIEWLTKTGRVFPEIVELLKRMKKESYK